MRSLRSSVMKGRGRAIQARPKGADGVGIDAVFVLERRGNIATGGQIAGLIVINLIFTFALASHISVGGHVGGLIGGVILMVLMVQFRRSVALAVAGTVAVAVAAVAIAYAKARGYS